MSSEIFRHRLPAVVLVAVAFFGSMRAHGQIIIEYETPTDFSQPLGITAGADGALWFTENHASKIGRIALDGTIVEFDLSPSWGGRGPWEITAGPDGNVWFTETWGDAIGRITPSGIVTEFPIPDADLVAWDIVAGPDGNLWFTESSSATPWSKIGRITPQGVITEFDVPTYGAGVHGITAGPDGAIWFAERDGDKIGRITTEGVITEFPVSPSAEPYSIAAGPDGALWFTEWLSPKIGRLTTDGTLTEFPVGGGPWAITSGPDGNLWLTNETDNSLHRVTTGGLVTTYPVPTHGCNPAGIAVGPDGGIWFTEFTGNKIGKLFQPPSPLVIAIVPSSGPSAGGTSIAIAGSGFETEATVTVGAPATDIVVVSEKEITATVPFRLPGTLTDVAVINPGATGTLPKGWFADFLDVDQSDVFHDYIEKIFRNGITAGCGGGNYCRNDPVTRDQMAVFLLKAEHGSTYLPPPCAGVFDDLPCPGLFTDWVEQLSAQGVTAGCGGGNYCPDAEVTRAQMAAFLLKTKNGPSYTPPGCTGIFDDVSCPSLFADWIEALYAEQVTGGCSASPLLYCPGSFVTRGQMAVFLVRAFGFP